MHRETRRTPRTGTPLYWSLSVAASRFRCPALRPAQCARKSRPAEPPALVAPFGAEILVSEVLLDVLVTDKKGNADSRPRAGRLPDHRGRQAGQGHLGDRSTAIAATSAPKRLRPARTRRRTTPGSRRTTSSSSSTISAATAPTSPACCSGRSAPARTPSSGCAAGWPRPTGWRCLGYDNRLKLFQDFSQDREALERAIQNATTGRGDRENFPSRQAPSTAGAPALAQGLPDRRRLEPRDRDDLRSAHAGRRRRRRRSSGGRTSCCSPSASGG